MSLDPSGASGFLCAQGARFLLHSGILIGAALLLARLFGKSGLARSAIYRAALLAVILAPVVSFSIERIGLSCAVRLPAAQPAVVMPADPAPMYASFGAAHAGAAHAAPPAKASRPMPKPATIIAALWAAGACLLMGWLLISHMALWRTRRRSVPVRDAYTLARLKSLCERLKVRAPGLRVSPEIGGPILTGALRPVVIIPQAQEEALLNGALDRVLMHELAHQARRDCLWNLLARVVCAVGFFQPLLWVLARRQEDASEDAADDRVLALGADARAYARDLATAAEEFVLRRPESVAGLGVIRFRSSLGRRVTHVLDTSRRWVSSLSWRAIALLCALTVLATILTATLSFAGPVESQPPKPAAPAINAPASSAEPVPAAKPAPAAEHTPETSLTLPNATDADLAAFKDKQDVRVLDLSNLEGSKVTDAGVAYVKEMKYLRKLTLDGANVTDAGVANLKELKNLRYLGLANTRVTDAGLVNLEEMKDLKTLDLFGTKVTGAGLAYLKEMKGLRFLILANSQVTDAGLANLREVKGLMSLWLGGTKLTDAGLANLKEMDGLEDLELRNTNVTDAGLANVKEMKSLWFLGLQNTQVTDAGLTQLKGMKGLHDIDLAGTQVTDRGLAQLKEMEGLLRIKLDRTRVTDAGLAQLTVMTGLQSLTLCDTNVTDVGLAQLKKLQGLQELGLAGTKVTDAGLVQLKEMKGLAVLNLDNTKVTDAGLAHLKEMKEMRGLSLCQTGVTDAGLADVKEMKGLLELRLEGTKVTAAGLADLKAALPNTRIDASAPAAELVPAAKPAPATEPARETEEKSMVDNREPKIKESAAIPGVGPLELKIGNQCTFIGAMRSALEAMGERVSYEELMGLSGAAFRLSFAQPRWDYSSVDGMLGYNHGAAAMKALGYDHCILSGSGNPHEPGSALVREEICRSIAAGRPVLGIDLVVAPEWGVIAGYEGSGKTWLCRSYFDQEPGVKLAANGYAYSDRWPWIRLVFGAKEKMPSARENLIAAMKVAVTFDKEDEYFTSGGGGRYARGLTAYKVWADGLEQEQRFRDEKDLMHDWEVNCFCFDALLDARLAAARYLKGHSGDLTGNASEHVSQAAGLYGEVAQLLQDARDKTVPIVPPGRPASEWTSQMRSAQAQLLLRCAQKEKQALAMLALAIQESEAR